ncbi:glycosyltransferase family 2 protein [Dictyobacter arantiisoli]|uniref:Glycosyltransferase 2-like domain-containing protein n=1 Tax=Dictyobacter arantiisoli TaxID=2014874 RepID=A0A5A5TEP5_9CHLR|nr:glycosyltransferase [Dictyobacter arantiisoli]GCF09882.1 hypothetical protein KDI_34460 [Dictyobacter arantiisoli]
MTHQHTAVHTAHISLRTRSTGAFRTGNKEQHQTGQQPVRPRFSVVICTYNRRTLVLAALASLRKQTLSYESFEVIVVDNGSEDGTFNAIQTYLGVDHGHQPITSTQWRAQCLLEKRNGLAYARNTGVSVACGEIIIFLDDDMFADPAFLERLQLAYQETQADAIGGCVELYWEAQKPYWLTDDMLETFGYYMPFRSRTRLPENINFAASCFSVKREALERAGDFSPFLTKRLHSPINAEVADLCRRLRLQQRTLWYEPTAIIMHRVSPARLARPFLVGRAYWQGRSEILAQYADIDQYQDAAGDSFLQTILSIWLEVKTLLQICLYQRPRLYLARKSTSERLHAAMSQARTWGRIQQRFMLSNHTPATLRTPHVLMVQAHEQDAALQAQALVQQGVYCTTCTAKIPFSWLWRHRAHQHTAVGILHLYQPGRFDLSIWQRHAFLLKLLLARWLGLGIVSTDAGGWWHNVRSFHSAARRAFERRIFAQSHIIYTCTRRPEQFYQDYSWHTRTHFLSHPGLQGVFTTTPERLEARQQLGLQANETFVYLCLAHLHTEHEIIYCIEAFSAMRTLLLADGQRAALSPQLLLVGTPRDKKQALKLIQRAALNPALHTFVDYHEADLPLYLAATNALIMPYSTAKTAGMPAIAMLCYSYERLVISPNLPRLYGLLPPHAGLLYDPTQRSSLVQTLLLAPQRQYQHTLAESAALDYRQGWKTYAQHLSVSYQRLLAIMSAPTEQQG